MDDQNAELLAQLDAEIDRLRRERPKDEADPDCAEIDSNITGLQFMRDKVMNASGAGTLDSIGHTGELLDIEALREDKTWRVAPELASMMLHLLLKGAQHAESIEQLKGLVAKAGEVMEVVWPKAPRAIEVIQHGKHQIVVPLQIGP